MTIEIIKRREVLKRALFALVCVGLSFGIKAQNNERYKSLHYYFEEPISSDSKFRVEDETIDKLGIKHITYQQLHNGVIVQDAILKFHYRKQNVSISGNPKVINSVSNGNLQLNEAKVFAKNVVKGKYREDYDTRFKPREPQRVIVETKNGFEECFKIDVYTIEPLARKDVYVGTTNGNIVRQDNRIHFADATGSATTKYSGVQTIITDSVTTDTFRLRDSGRNVETYNMEQGWFGNGIDFIDDDNSWNNVNVAQDEVATDAHWASEMFYDYLLNEHGRNSYDNAGDTLITKVHYGNN
jgi:Zn-dependent metalloprotease